MTAYVQDNRTNETRRISGKNLSIGVHDGWSMLHWEDEAGELQYEIVDATKYYITCV